MPVPESFHEHASGLLVPDEVARVREAWTRDEWKVLERATKLLKARRIQIFLRCDEPACQKAPMTRVRSADGGITLRCEHKDRVFVGSL